MTKIKIFRQIYIVSAALLAYPLMANVVGPDTQNFNAVPDGLDFVTVESSQVLKPGVFNLGLFLNDAHNTLPSFPKTTTDGTEKVKLSDELVGADFNFAVGITKSFEFGLSVPHVLMQSVHTDDLVLHGEFTQQGMTEIRPLIKWKLFGGTQGGVAIITSLGVNMVQDNPWVGDGAPPIANFELATDKRINDVRLALNLGYRKRTPGTKIPNTPVDPVGSQFIASSAGSLLIQSIRSRLVAEVFGSWPTASTTAAGDRAASSGEGLLGLKHDVSADLSLHIGGGAGLWKGIASPDWRVYAGINYAFGPVFGRRENDEVRRRKTPPKPVAKAPVSDYVPAPDLPVINEDAEVESNVDDALADQIPPHEETIVFSNVLFAFDKDRVVLEGAKTMLAKLATYLKRPPEFRHLTIEGHTDYMGSNAYNQDLSERRARAIKRYLVDVLKLDSSRIDAIGYGETRPVADNGNYQGRQKNRRVEFKISR